VEQLVADGVIEPVAMPWGAEQVDANAVEAWKMPVLRQAAERVAHSPACKSFAKAEKSWLAGWARYAARVEREKSTAWWNWPALDEAQLATEISIQVGLQYLFAHQWARLREAAQVRGIRIVGDVPIFVTHDACDVWQQSALWLWGSDGQPDPVSGVPPDYFSPTGQRWGSPMYDWEAHRKTGFAWWRSRMKRELSLVDAVRLDHFRGFCAAWAIPASEDDARKGRWTNGPGRELFDALRAELGELPLWAEDLGEITPDVEQLRDELGLPGMKILQFAFGTNAGHPFLPHNYQGTKWIAYTGSHDNDTAVGWYESANDEVKHRFRVYTGRDGSDPAWGLVRETWASVAETAIAPMQDVLKLGGEARMNTPGVATGNWGWRLRELPWQVCAPLSELCKAFGRGLA
jgi:4-alpha-glucanotransferase